MEGLLKDWEESLVWRLQSAKLDHGWTSLLEEAVVVLHIRSLYLEQPFANFICSCRFHAWQSSILFTVIFVSVTVNTNPSVPADGFTDHPHHFLVVKPHILVPLRL